MATRSDNSTPVVSDRPTNATTNAIPDTDQRHPDRPTRDYRGTGIMWSAVALLLAIAALLVVVIQNTHDVTFEFLWVDVDAPLSLLLAIAVGSAVLLGELVGVVWRRRRRTRLREREELRQLRDRSA